MNELKFSLLSIDEKKDGDKVEKEKQIPAVTGHCYCYKDRNLKITELLCANCKRWFHEHCISFQIGKVLPFITDYVFLCKNCSPTGQEQFKRTETEMSQLCVTAIANLVQEFEKKNNTKALFHKDKEIIEFIEEHWEKLTTAPKSQNYRRQSDLFEVLVEERGSIFALDDNDIDESMYGLVNTDLSTIGPKYEAMIEEGILKVTKSGVQIVDPTIGCSSEGGSPVKGVRGTIKRKNISTRTGQPLTTDYYRYTSAEPDPLAAEFQKTFDAIAEKKTRIPGWLYRPVTPDLVLLSMNDRAYQLKVSKDRLSVSGEGGYCLIRASHSVDSGTWYWEAIVEEMPEGSATRLGWSQKYANLQSPVGSDKFGYSWRSMKGTRFHEGAGKRYSDEYKEGDVLGFLIILPDRYNPSRITDPWKNLPLIMHRSLPYYRENIKLPEVTKALKPLSGSQIIFYKNGVSQGEAFLDIYDGAYYPSVAIYKRAEVSVNFGPYFECAPKDVIFKGMHEKAEEHVVELAMADMLYFIENEEKFSIKEAER